MAANDIGHAWDAYMKVHAKDGMFAWGIKLADGRICVDEFNQLRIYADKYSALNDCIAERGERVVKFTLRMP